MKSKKLILKVPLIHHAYKLVEQVPAIMWAGGGFGMVLHREKRFSFYPDSFYGIIIEVNMCHLDMVGIFYRFRVNAKPMVLGGNLALSGNHVFYRMVQAPMAMVHFKCRDAMCKRQ